MISGGYVLQPRCIKDSEISRKPPHYREVWDYLNREANHKEGKSSGRIIKRGELFRSVKQIQHELRWNEGWCERSYTTEQIRCAIDWLEKEEMITKQRTTRGLLIGINNYETYQNPNNYIDINSTSQRRPHGRPHSTPLKTNDETQTGKGFEVNNEFMQTTQHTTMQPLRTPLFKQEGRKEERNNYTIEERILFEKFQFRVQNEFPNVARMKEPFTIEQYLKVKGKYSEQKIFDLIEDMYLWEGLIKRNSAYKTFLTFAKRSKQNEPKRSFNSYEPDPTKKRMVI